MQGSLASPSEEKSRRLGSVDALRGLTVAAMLLMNDPGSWKYVFAPLQHSHWHGFTPTDFVFPMFLFIVGVSIALAVLPKIEAGRATAPLRNAALKRAMRIVIAGLLINAIAMWLYPDRGWRYWGVLQRIGICFAVAAVFAIYTPRRAWWVSLVGLLVGYSIILRLGGSLEKWFNIVDQVDTTLFGSYVYNFKVVDGGIPLGHDPEGLLSTLSALANTLLGLCAGVWLRERKTRRLLGLGGVLLVIGWIWHYWMPFNKNLWTPSFAVWAAGLSTVLLLAFHVAIDHYGIPAIGRRFGMNAISAYAGSQVMAIVLVVTGGQTAIFTFLAPIVTPYFGSYVASLSYAVLFVLFWWLVVLVMDWRRWYIKI